MLYSVKKLAKLAGVSVRTLHLYDQMGLLTPAERTEAGYRLYGEQELLRLQQVLFYRELDIPLKEIREILDDPGFDLQQALKSHKIALQARRDRITTMLVTIDKTIDNLNGKMMLSHEELYEGLPKDKAEAYRKGAIEKWGEEAVLKSENALKKLNEEAIKKLKAEMEDINRQLAGMMQEDPASKAVQEQIARHYQNIRSFWGTSGSPDLQAEAYAGLGDLYVADNRYTSIDGEPNAAFAAFMQKAMGHFAKTRLS